MGTTFWHVRLVTPDGKIAPFAGWVVQVVTKKNCIQPWQAAIDKVKETGVDNGPEGEFAAYPEFIVDILEFQNGVALL